MSKVINDYKIKELSKAWIEIEEEIGTI